MSTPELKPETPITDAAAYDCTPRTDFRGPELVVPADFARKLESALNAAREAIENAPHTETCQAVKVEETFGYWLAERCDCWKAEALAQIDKALSPQQSKTT